MAIRKDRSGRRARLALAAFVLAVSAVELGSESLTLQAYFPSPLGIYNQLTTTADSTLARDAGTVTIGGTPTNAVKLNVIGSMQMTDAQVQGMGGLSLSQLRPIVCSAKRTKTVGAANGMAWCNNACCGFSFTAAECGGTLPDASYVPAAQEDSVCGGTVSFSYGSNPPGVTFCPVDLVAGMCAWAGGTSVSMTATYFKKW